MTISSPSVSGIITDGTVVWTIRQIMSTENLYGFKSGVLKTGSAQIHTKTDTYRFSIFSANTLSDSGGFIHLYPSNFDDIDSIGKFVIGATSKTATSKNLEGYPSGALTWVGNDLGGSAIIAKSLGTNGYIKYASGLILQWGTHQATSNGVTHDFPISFTNTVAYINIKWTSHFQSAEVYKAGIIVNNKSSFTLYGFDTTSRVYYCFAIGY